MRDDPAVVDLVVRARNGDQDAWDAIVDRYAALIWSVCRRHGLSTADAEDVGGNVWLLLVEHLATIREPAALPGWLATTARRECLQVLRGKKRQLPVEDFDAFDAAGPVSEDGLLVEERRHALRLAFAELQARCRDLLTLLFDDPPPRYAQISATLGMPVGAIGPNRQRCLERLRRNPMLVQLGFATAEAGTS